MTPPPAGSEVLAVLTRETLEALTRCGLSERDSRPLRFAFEAGSRRGAVAVATELRTYAADAVQVRPSLRRALGAMPWTVTITTPPVPLVPGVFALWERAMSDVARDVEECRLVRGHTVLQAADRRAARR